MRADTIELSWLLRGPGSARFSWSTAGEEPVVISTSYVGDGLPEIIEAGIDLVLGARSTFATLLGEPVGYRIFLSGAGERVYVQIVRFEDPGSFENRWSGGTLRWEGRVSTTSLIRAIYDMANAVISQYGLDEYRRLWKYPFPTERFEVLRSLVAESDHRHGVRRNDR